MANNSLIQIGTHSGSFHGDDVLAVAILTTIFTNHQIVRTRDTDILEEMDFVVDVGDVYNHATRRYDHHMTDPACDRHGHMFSSAGLIWRHYAKTYLTAIGMPREFTHNGFVLNLLQAVEKNIRSHWIVPIDRADNGMAQGLTPISELVRCMRPTDPQKSMKQYDTMFLETVSMVSFLFKRACFHSADHAILKLKSRWEEKRYLHDERIVVVQHPLSSYKPFALTPVEMVIHPAPQYEGSDDHYIIRFILDPVSKINKVHLPSNVLGARSGVIEDVLGVKGISYIHHRGHLAFADSEEEAIAAAEKILQESGNHTSSIDILPD